MNRALHNQAKVAPRQMCAAGAPINRPQGELPVAGIVCASESEGAREAGGLIELGDAAGEISMPLCTGRLPVPTRGALPPLTQSDDKARSSRRDRRPASTWHQFPGLFRAILPSPSSATSQVTLSDYASNLWPLYFFPSPFLLCSDVPLLMCVASRLPNVKTYVRMQVLMYPCNVFLCACPERSAHSPGCPPYSDIDSAKAAHSQPPTSALQPSMRLN